MENFPLNEFQFIGHFSAYAVDNGVHIGMSGVNIDIVFNRFDKTAFDPVVGNQVLKGFDAEWMMTDHQVVITGNRFFYYIFCHIGTEEYGRYFIFRMSADESRIVVIFLKT